LGTVSSGRLKGIAGVHVCHGMNARDAFKAADKLGCSVEVDGGERVVGHPLMEHRVRTRHSNNRKDASRDLTGFLLSLKKKLQASKESEPVGMSFHEKESRRLIELHGTFMRRTNHGLLYSLPNGDTVLIHPTKGGHGLDQRTWRNTLADIKRALGDDDNDCQPETDSTKESEPMNGQSSTRLAELGIHIQKKVQVVETTTTSVVLTTEALALLVGQDAGDTYELVDASDSPVLGPLTLRILKVVERDKPAARSAS
jgi:hypothetical protein